jgi:CRISPR-associated endonuclease/helicase Cas3
MQEITPLRVKQETTVRSATDDTSLAFWAKTTQDGKPGISVENHMMIVGSIAKKLAQGYPIVMTYLGLNTALVGALAAMHDVGKISPGFQRKCLAWLENNGFLETDRLWN